MGYQTSRASYKDALAALQEKYTDKDHVKQHLCPLLLDCKSTAYNLLEFASCLSNYQSTIRNFWQYVTSVNKANWLLEDMLLHKLPY